MQVIGVAENVVTELRSPFQGSEVGQYVGEEAASPTARETVITEWVMIVFLPKKVVAADFEEPRTIQDLANEQREFLSTVEDDLTDVELPFDN